MTSPTGPRKTWHLLAGVALAALLAYELIDHVRRDTGANNTHVWQAAALLRGRLDIEREMHDCVVKDGKIYSYAPPFPAILLVPVVAVFGVTATSTFVVKLLLTAVNVAVCRSLLLRLGLSRADAWWLTAAMLLGTAYWFCVSAEGVWWFSQVVAVTFMLLAVREALGPARGWLMGLFLGCALLSRQMTVYSGLFLAAAAWEHWQPRRATLARLVNLLLLGATAAAAVGFYLWFNYACFGDSTTPGVSYVKVGPVWTANIERYGIMNLAYVPFNLVQMLFQGFHFELTEDALKMDRNGTSLTFASPFVFAAFLARGRGLLIPAAWASVVLTLGHQLIYYSNGWAQVNAQRYTLDFLPVLLPLIALGTRRLSPGLWKSAVVYSIALNFLALVLLPRGWSLLTRLVPVAVGPSATP